MRVGLDFTYRDIDIVVFCIMVIAVVIIVANVMRIYVSLLAGLRKKKKKKKVEISFTSALLN